MLKLPFKILGYLAVGCISLYLASLVYILSFGTKTNVPAHADAILVLGAKVNLDNSPSPTLYNRTLEGVQLYDQDKADYIITTGGVGLGSSAEGKVAGKVAIQKGVPKDKVLEDTSSHDTFQNISEAKKIAQQKNIHSVIVVSDRFHVARGVLVAKHLGFDPVYWDFPKQSYYTTKMLIQNYAREALALIFYIPKVYSSSN